MKRNNLKARKAIIRNQTGENNSMCKPCHGSFGYIRRSETGDRTIPVGLR